MATPPKSTLFWALFNRMAAANARLYRLSGGRLGNRIGRAPVLLLHHVGRRSGKARVSPLIYQEDGGRLVVVASKGGFDADPAWLGNLMASPETEVEVGRERRRVRARQAGREERDALWPRLVEMYPAYADYQRSTDRVIPVVVLDPR